MPQKKLNTRTHRGRSTHTITANTHTHAQAHSGTVRGTHRATQLHAQHLEILSIRIVVQVTARKGNRPSEREGRGMQREGEEERKSGKGERER